ncbi:MAG: hypothetical protein ACI8QZ_004248 [Chlamydiales bacterium]|jgi:hypothetical protein
MLSAPIGTLKRLATVATMILIGSVSAQAHVSLLLPNGGEVLQVGETYQVRWTVDIAHNLQNWDLWYSTTGAAPWTALATDLPPGSGAVGSIHTYDWTVPDDPSATVRVRVRMENTGTNYLDISDEDLTINAVAPTIPTMSEWGLALMTLLLLGAGVLLLRRRQVFAGA